MQDRNEKEHMTSVNEDVLAADLPLEELERRLEMEELETRGSMWTGCGCDCDTYTEVCGVDW